MSSDALCFGLDVALDGSSGNVARYGFRICPWCFTDVDRAVLFIAGFDDEEMVSERQPVLQKIDVNPVNAQSKTEVTVSMPRACSYH